MDDTTSATEALLKKKKSGGSKGADAPAKVDDLIITTSNEIENLDREEAFELIPELHDSVDFAYFRLGGVLSVVQGKEAWWKDEGYDNFRQFIEGKFGLQYRKAMYLISIYGALVESGVKWESLGGIGWSKAKEIAAILTPSNVDEWVEKAQNATVLQLKEMVKKAQLGTLDKTDTTPDTGDVTTFTVKVHPDQKENINLAIEKAMKEANTEHKGVALEAIGLNYLSGAKVSKPKSLEEVIKGYTYEEVLTAFTKVWPEIDLTVHV